jgi:hypothetical protein
LDETPEYSVRLKLALLCLTVLLLSSCGSPGKGTPTVTQPTQTAQPTPTATPEAQPLTILILPADMPQDEYDRYQTQFYDLAQAAGMRFQVRNGLTAEGMAAEGTALKVVVALPPDPGLAELAAAAPQVQFLAISVPGVTAGGNLSTVGGGGAPIDQQAFLAGYIAALVAPEWKTGILYPKDDPDGEAAKTAFANGFVFFCGICRNPVFSQPSGIYPVTVPIPADAKAGEYPAYADVLWHNGVKAAAVFPPLASADLLVYMGQANLLVIGESMPEGMDTSKWVASIEPDLNSAIEKIFPDLAAGKGGQAVPTPLFLTEVNKTILTEGKLRLAQQVLDGLQDGTIGTGVTR